MSTIKRCKTCLGQKTVMGLGMIEHKCKTCAGTGRVFTDSEGQETKIVAPESPKIITSKVDNHSPKVDKRSKEYRASIIAKG